MADGGFPRASPLGGGFPWLIGGYPRLIRGVRVLHSWETPIMRHPRPSPASSLPSNIPGRMISRGNCFPRHSLLPGTRHGVTPPIFRPYVVFSVRKHYFIGQFKTRHYRNSRNKNRKNTNSFQSSPAIDPAKRDTKRTQIELAMLDFQTEHCQLTTRV